MSLSYVGSSNFSWIQYFSTLKICSPLEFCFRNVRPRTTSNFSALCLKKEIKYVSMIHEKHQWFNWREGCMRVIPTFPRSSVQQIGPSRNQWGLLHKGESAVCNEHCKHLWLPARAGLWCRLICPQICERQGDSGCCPSACRNFLQRGQVGGEWLNKI